MELCKLTPKLVCLESTHIVVSVCSVVWMYTVAGDFKRFCVLCLRYQFTVTRHHVAVTFAKTIAHYVFRITNKNDEKIHVCVRYSYVMSI